MKTPKKLIISCLTLILVTINLELNATFFTPKLFKKITFSEAKPFRREYKYVTMMADGKWEPTIKSHTIFLFNVNGSKQVNIYHESGKKSVLTLVGKIEESSVEGFNYQKVKALTDDNFEIEIKLFSDQSNGVYLVINNKSVIQFHD